MANNGVRLFLCCFFVSWVAPCFAGDVQVNVEAVTAKARTDEDFICATLDWWPPEKCNYKQCPWGQAGILNLDLDNRILSNAIKAFKHLRIRVGGSLQDRALYKIGKAVKNFPHFKKNDNEIFGFTRGSLPMDRWDKLNKLFNQTSAKVTFGLNALLGKKQVKGSTLWLGHWYSQNAHDLMAYTVSKGYKIDSYELGNELCSSGVEARVPVEQYSEDIIALKQLVEKIYTNPEDRPKVLGPAGFFDRAWFISFLELTGMNVIDGLTHHIYNLGPGDDPALINNVQDPYFLDQVAQTYKDISTITDQFGPWSGAWVGESGGAYNSGGKDVSHTFADGFWYMDQLGMTASFNHKVFCRQSLIGGNYGFLNTTTFIPNPDYYGALLWHRLMGKNVLHATHSGSPYLRVYSHCSRHKRGVTLLIINMSNSTAFNVSVLNDGYEYPVGYDAAQREEYHLSPRDGNIQSDVVLLNGTPLVLTPSLDIPDLHPKLVDPSTPILVVPDSIVFAALTGFKAPACA